MNNQDLDIFKKLDSYNSVVDTDKLWSGIEPALPTKPARRRGVVFWPFALIGLALLAGVFWFYAAQEYQVHTASEIAKLSSTQVQTMLQQPEQKAEITKKTSANKTIECNASPFAHGQEGLVNKQEQGVINSGVLASEGLSYDDVFTSSTQNPTASSSEIAWAEMAVTEQIKPQTPSTKLGLDVLMKLPPIQATVRVPFRTLSLQRPEPQTGCYDWSGLKGIFRPYLGIYAGAHLPIRKIEPKTREHDTFAASRVATEKNLESVNGGAFFGLQAKNGLSVEGGFEYLRINERFRATDSTIVQIGKVVTTGYIITAPGDTTFVLDTVDVLQTTVNTRTIYNHYSFMSIPIGVGFTFNQKAPLKPYLKGGIQINIGTRQKVGMLDSDGQYRLYKSSDFGASGFPFRTTVGILPFVQAGARVSLGGELEAFGEVRYLFMQRDITTDSFPLRQRYRAVGAQLGLRLGL